MDRSWIVNNSAFDRRQAKYVEGVDTFLDFAFSGKDEGAVLRCPCKSCLLSLFKNRDTMWHHLMLYGIKNDYILWEFHGEDCTQYSDDNDELEEDSYACDVDLTRDDMVPLLHEASNIRFSANLESNNSAMDAEFSEGTDEMPTNFERLMKSAEADLYPGCKTFSKLEFMIVLLHIKVSHQWSDKSFSMLLTTLHRAFDYDETFPKNSYEAKKYTKDLGLNYVKIDACVNHCVLFRKEFANYNACPKCGCSRWKAVAHGHIDSDGEEEERTQKEKKIPQLVLRHFPLIPRLQRIYMSSKLARYMRWHKQSRRDDGILRHPADSKAWKCVDEFFPSFASDPRNVRLGLASDGFNPAAQMSSTYNIWPVFLVPYNLPPWMCMKRENMILSLLIPGPKSPGNDIDVFLQPLIDELKDLWDNGVKTYDVYSKKTFNLHAMLMWTINDFPAYANLSGWSTKGALACPDCHTDTKSDWLDKGHKYCYMHSRTFLPLDHRWRQDENQFGSVESAPPPTLLKGVDIVKCLFEFRNSVTFGKAAGKQKRGDRYLVQQWKKLSVFFELPYWKHLLIRHNLDVMHIEKNVCDSILGTLLDIRGKNKDSLKARLDLIKLKLHKRLQPKRVGEKYQVPKAPYNLTLGERRQIAKLLSMLTLPDGYSSNIGRCVSVDDGKLSGMKSHDCHVFMQDLLVPAFRGVLSDSVLQPLAELSSYFKQLCSKVLSVDLLEQMEKNIVITLCKLERIFIPAFFDVMVHLTIHLATEAKIAGPVHYRWMYPFEREMHTFKSFVRNKARPEGSIAEAYIGDECLTFCSRYFTKTETRYNRLHRNDDVVDHHHQFELPIFSKMGRPLGKATHKQLSFEACRQAQIYVLNNCSAVDRFSQEYENIDGECLAFDVWFERRIQQLWKQGDETVSEELLCLAKGPLRSVTSYRGYIINGYRFHTKTQQRKRKTQNSGVVVKGDDASGCRDFFGVLEEVVVLEYDALSDNRIPKVVLFKCKWYDVYSEGRGIKIDKFGTKLVNVSRTLQTNEPFALAAQVHQVFYVQTHKELQWRVVIKTNPRDYFDLSMNEEEEGFFGPEQEQLPNIHEVREGIEDEVSIVRTDMEPELANIDDDDGGGGGGGGGEEEEEEEEGQREEEEEEQEAEEGEIDSDDIDDIDSE